MLTNEFLNNFEVLMRVLPAVIVFFGLYLIYYLILKMLSWTSDEALLVGRKINFQAIGFAVSFSLWWFLLDLPPFRYKVTLVNIAWCASIFFAILFILDLLNHLFFDIYTPRVRGVRVPQIISNLVRGLYFLGIVIFILGSILGLDIRPFLTGSAILTAIIGLALQDTLGNLFSGLALHISRPFDIGHWVKYQALEGSVVKIDWRATTIKTRQEDYITIPNSQLAKVEVTNFSAPTQIHGIFLEVGVRYDYPPNLIKGILTEAALYTEGVVNDILPEIFLTEYADFAIRYKMKFFIRDYRFAPIIKAAVMEKIWYMFRRENIEIPFPIRDVYMRQEKENASISEIITMLTRIDFLESLSNEELKDVAERLRPVIYSSGETIIKQGDPGDSFYILKRGHVKVVAKNENGEIFLSRNLEEGSFFGEISVLTGEPRTADIIAVTDTELLMLKKSDMEMLLRKFPDMDRKISEKIAARQKQNFEQLELAKHRYSESEAEKKVKNKVDSLSQQILTKIRNFFAID